MNEIIRKRSFRIIINILFIINSSKFLNNPSPKLHKLAILYNMIIYLAIIILSIHIKGITFMIISKRKYRENLK